MSSDQYFTAPIHAESAVNRLYDTGFPEFYRSHSGFVGPRMIYDSYLSGFYA